MPRIVRLFLTQTLVGFLLSAGFLAVLLWADVGGLWGRVTTSPDGLAGAALIFVMNGFLFSAAQIAVRVFLMAERDDDDDSTPGGGMRLQPVRVRQNTRPGRWY